MIKKRSKNQEIVDIVTGRGSSLGLITGPILAGILFDIQIDLPLLCGVVIIYVGYFCRIRYIWKRSYKYFCKFNIDISIDKVLYRYYYILVYWKFNTCVRMKFARPCRK